MFDDRKDAGKHLGKALSHFKGQDVVVLAIPRGGVEVGVYVAEELEARLSIVCVRKLPFPDNPESGFGAVAEDGSLILLDRYHERIDPQVKERVIEEQKTECQRRVEELRDGKPLPELEGKTVILVDDGIAMGSTMRAAIMLCRNQKADKVVVGAPVSGPAIPEIFTAWADEVVILKTPIFFHAVAEIYKSWYDVTEEEVHELLERAAG